MNDEDVAIGKRLRRVIADGGKLLKDGARVAGVTDKTFQRWLNGEGSADAKGLARVAEWAGTTVDYLITGIGRDSGDWETEGDFPAGFVKVPVYAAAVAAGDGRTALDAGPYTFVLWPEDLLRQYGRIEDLKLFPIVGDSMEPELSDGGLALINIGQSQPRDGIVMARLGDDLMIKRMRLLGGGRAELVSINPAYQPIAIDLLNDDFAVVGKAAMGFKGL